MQFYYFIEGGRVLHNYISVYENVLNKQFCEKLIEKFEVHPNLQETEQITAQDGWHMHFKQIKLAKYEIFTEENQQLRSLFLNAIAAYKKEHGIKKYQWPQKFTLEPIRMKRYLPDSDERFDEHVEITNLETARRSLVALIYLNDDFDGGETEFTQFDISVQPKQGAIMLFPAMWNWLHKGNPVKKKAKYIVGTMMHYV